MTFLRKVKRVRKVDGQKNDDIRKELEVRSMLEDIDRQKLKWFAHIVRMSQQMQGKQI